MDPGPARISELKDRGDDVRRRGSRHPTWLASRLSDGPCIMALPGARAVRILTAMPLSDLAAFDVLSLYRYRVELRLSRPLLLPAHRRAVLWRGAFGSVFRSLVCHDVALACEACPLRSACPFPRVFAPTIPPGRPELARLRDPPRPFVFVDPHPAAPSLPAEEIVTLGLTLVGTAVADLPYFVVALRRLGEEGIGPARVRFEVEAVRCADASGLSGPTVFERGADIVRPTRVALRARDFARPGDASVTRVLVRFLTPTDLRAENAGAPSSGVPTLPFRGDVADLREENAGGPLAESGARASLVQLSAGAGEEDAGGPGAESGARVREAERPSLGGRNAAVSTELTAPSFGTLVRRARGRAGALATFYGEGPIAHEAVELGVRADSVVLERAEVRRAEATRTSSRTGQRHPIGGVVGSAIYSGESISEMMPWLRLAEVLGVGKHATFGNGRISVESLG